MDKIILVHYLRVSEHAAIDFIKNKLMSYKNAINTMDENIINIVLPIKHGDSKIECINPKLVTLEEYSKALEIVNNAKIALDEFISESKPTKKSIFGWLHNNQIL